MLIRESFPSVYASTVRGAERQRQRFEQALDRLNEGLLSGSIRNVEMKDVKRWCSDIARDLWDEKIADVHFNAGKYQQLPGDLVDFYYSITIMGIHSLSSIDKKLQKTKIDHPMIDSMRSLVAELKPLATTIDSLKSGVVMGRAPSTEPPKPVNPNKVVKTCPCCQRSIAVVGGTMAHHGYERRGNGWQTQSCPGIRFPPIEVSNAGLKWMIESHEESLQHTIKLQGEKDSLKSLQTNIAGNVVTIRPDSSRWRNTLRAYEERLERDVRWYTEDLVMMKKRLADWKPEVAPAKDDDSPSP